MYELPRRWRWHANALSSQLATNINDVIQSLALIDSIPPVSSAEGLRMAERFPVLLTPPRCLSARVCTTVILLHCQKLGGCKWGHTAHTARGRI